MGSLALILINKIKMKLNRLFLVFVTFKRLILSLRKNNFTKIYKKRTTKIININFRFNKNAIKIIICYKAALRLKRLMRDSRNKLQSP